MSALQQPIAGLATSNLIDAYLASLDVKPISKDGYRRRLKQFFIWVSANNRDLSRESLNSYKADLRQAGYSALTVCAYLVPIRGLFRWTSQEGLYQDIASALKPPKRPRGFRKDPLTINQAVRLLDSIELSSLKDLRDLAIINLMLRTGPRTIEIVRANVGDIRQESGEIVLWLQGKGSDEKDAFVVLTDETLRPIHAYLFARKAHCPSEPLFTSTSDSSYGNRLSTRAIRKIVKGRLRGIHIDSPRVSAHSLRHSAVTFALLGGASIQEVQQLARHTSINTTMIYAHNVKRAAGIPERMINALFELTKTTKDPKSGIPR